MLYIKITFIRVKILPYIMMHSYPYAEIFWGEIDTFCIPSILGGKARQNKYVCLGLPDLTHHRDPLHCVFCGECF